MSPKPQLSFAWSGLTSFSAAPLRLVTWLGVVVSIASILTALWAFLVKYFSPEAVPGWASILIPLLCLGGVQILCIGIIGEYLGKMFSGGNLGKLRYALKKELAVKIWRRHVTVGDISAEDAHKALNESDCTPDEADAIFKLTALATFKDRFVIPPSQREMAMEMLDDPQELKAAAGFGFRSAPKRS